MKSAAAICALFLLAAMLPQHVTAVVQIALPRAAIPPGPAPAALPIPAKTPPAPPSVAQKGAPPPKSPPKQKLSVLPNSPRKKSALASTPSPAGTATSFGGGLRGRRLAAALVLGACGSLLAIGLLLFTAVVARGMVANRRLYRYEPGTSFTDADLPVASLGGGGRPYLGASLGSGRLCAAAITSARRSTLARVALAGSPVAARVKSFALASIPTVGGVPIPMPGVPSPPPAAARM